MSIRVVIEKTLEDWWGLDEEFSRMTDADILDLLNEDTGAVLENATWKIERSQETMFQDHTQPFVGSK